MAITVLRYNNNGTSAGAPALSGSAGSLITVLDFCLVTTLGWTKTAGTNNGIYRAPTGNRRYLAVWDGTTTYATMRGFENATVNTNMSTTVPTYSTTRTLAFPTSAQHAAALPIAKSDVADTSERPWTFVSNGTSFYFCCAPLAAGAATDWVMMFFGDYESYKAGDVWNTAITSHNDVGDTTNNSPVALVNTIDNLSLGLFSARSYTQIGGSVAMGRSSDPVRSKASPFMGYTGGVYPSPIEGGLLLGGVFVHELAGIRGRMPGLWNPLHPAAMGHGDTFSGSGELAGRTFEVFSGVANQVRFVLETSDTWGTF